MHFKSLAREADARLNQCRTGPPICRRVPSLCPFGRHQLPMRRTLPGSRPHHSRLASVQRIERPTLGGCARPQSRRHLRNERRNLGSWPVPRSNGRPQKATRSAPWTCNRKKLCSIHAPMRTLFLCSLKSFERNALRIASLDLFASFTPFCAIYIYIDGLSFSPQNFRLLLCK